MHSAIGIIFGLLSLVSVILAAHYLQQIRDILVDMQKTQKKIAQRMGCTVDKR